MAPSRSRSRVSRGKRGTGRRILPSAVRTATAACSWRAAGSRRSDSHAQLDLNYTQNIRLGRYTLQLLADVYNVFDNQTGYSIQPVLTSPTFGEPRLFFDPRRFQLAARFQLGSESTELTRNTRGSKRGQGETQAFLFSSIGEAVPVPLLPRQERLEQLLSRDQLPRRRVGVHAGEGDTRGEVGFVQQHADLRALEEGHRIGRV